MTIDSQRIEIMMAERGMTKKALAESCGLSTQNVSTIIVQKIIQKKDTIIGTPMI